MKTSQTALIPLLFLLILVGCQKDEIDFRIKYLGDFQFEAVREFWMLGQPTIYDTTNYHGVIRKYELMDSENDLYFDDDSHENPDEKITIKFKENVLITSLIDENGKLIPKSGYHYCVEGEFVHIDTIEFYVGSLGGLGGGENYWIKGIRNK